jgi:hypothetical protein
MERMGKYRAFDTTTHGRQPTAHRNILLDAAQPRQTSSAWSGKPNTKTSTYASTSVGSSTNAESCAVEHEPNQYRQYHMKGRSEEDFEWCGQAGDVACRPAATLSNAVASCGEVLHSTFWGQYRRHVQTSSSAKSMRNQNLEHASIGAFSAPALRMCGAVVVPAMSFQQHRNGILHSLHLGRLREASHIHVYTFAVNEMNAAAVRGL